MRKISSSVRNISDNRFILCIIGGSSAHILTKRQFVAGIQAAAHRNGVHHLRDSGSLRRNFMTYWGNHLGKVEFHKYHGMGFGWGKTIQEEATTICKRWNVDPKTITDIASVISSVFCLETALSLSNWTRAEPEKRIWMSNLEFTYLYSYIDRWGVNERIILNRKKYPQFFKSRIYKSYEEREKGLERVKEYIKKLGEKVLLKETPKLIAEGALKVGSWERPKKIVEFTDSFGVTRSKEEYVFE